MPFLHRVSATSLATLALFAAAPAFAGPAQGAECELNEVFRTGGAPSDAILARDHAFIATHIGVEMFSLLDPAGLVSSGVISPEPASALALRGDVMLVVADRQSGDDALLLFDIAGAPKVQQLGSISWAAAFQRSNHVSTRGGLALVSCGSLGAILIDISDPAQPQILSTLTPPPGTLAERVALLDGAAAVFLHNGLIATYDLSNLAAPLPLSQTPGVLALNLTSQGDIVYAVNALGLTTIDFSHPASPVTLSTLSITDPSDIDLVGRIAHISSSTDGSIKRVDVSDPAAPFVIDGCCPEGGVFPEATFVASSNTRSALLTRRSIRIIDTSGEASELLNAEPRMNAPRGFAVEGSLLAVNSGWGMQMARIDVEGRIDMLGAYDFGAVTLPPSSHAASLRHNRAAVVARSPAPTPQAGHVLHLLNVSDATHPTLVSTAAIPDTGAAPFATHRLEMIDETVFVCTRYDEFYSRLWSFNAAAPDLDLIGQRPGTDIAARNNVLFVLDRAAEGQLLRALDALQPATLPELGASGPLPTPDSDWSFLRLDGGFAYAVDARSGAVATLDASDVEDIRCIGVAPLPDDPDLPYIFTTMFEAHERIAYIGYRSTFGGFETDIIGVYDISNPNSAELLARWRAQGPFAPTSCKTPTGILVGGIHFSFVSCPCPADLDGDGFVGMADLMLVVDAFNTNPSDPNYNPNADTNGDKVIDFADLNLVLSAFNTDC